MNNPEREQKRLGAGMFLLAWIAFMVLLGVYFNDMLEGQHNPNQTLTTTVSGGAREVVLQQNRFGHYVTSGKINGSEVVFMVDTGATTIAIPGQVAAALDLTVGRRFRTQTANGAAEAFATTLASVSVGEIRLEGVTAAVSPGLNTREVLLGMSFLQQIEFTQRGDTLILRQYPDSNGF
jgi:aspartyl protease family protein